MTTPPTSPVDEAAVEAAERIGRCFLVSYNKGPIARIISDAYAELGFASKHELDWINKQCDKAVYERKQAEARLTSEREAILNHLACINGDGGHRADEFDSVLNAIKDATATHYKRIERHDREQFAEREVREKLVKACKEAKDELESKCVARGLEPENNAAWCCLDSALAEAVKLEDGDA